MKRIFLYFLILCFCSCYDNNTKRRNGSPISDASKSASEPNTVVYIVDGDTFDVIDNSGKIIRIRPIGINTDEPQNNRHGQKGPFAQQAKKYLSDLIFHKKVRLEMDVQKTDQYKRILAYVFVDDSLFVNAEMIKQGYAMIETHPPNVRYADYFYELQQEARTEKRGMWANYSENISK